jgi:hypothetical protein
MPPTMKTSPNIVKFLLDGDSRIPLNTIDQKRMRELRRHADTLGKTVPELIHDIVEQGFARAIAEMKAQKELQSKIVKFPAA